MKTIALNSQKLTPGRYIVAVSGGVDSMVLLDLLRRQPGLELIVAHLDHGIRQDSRLDREIVESVSKSHNLEFVYEEAELGEVSEEKARERRYDFLRRMVKKYNTKGTITAHHQDDLLETVIINLLRGTGRRGLSPLIRADVVRPLLHVTKAQIVAYARDNGITWREDITNQDQTYLRNYVRHNLVSSADDKLKKQLLDIIVRLSELNQVIDTELNQWLAEHVILADTSAILPRYSFVMLPTAVSYELFQQLARQLTGNTLEKSLAYKAILFLKTARPNKYFSINKTWHLYAKRREVMMECRGCNH